MEEKPLTHTFVVDVTSQVTGKQYQGQFTTKKLTLGDIMNMGVRKAQLLSGFSYNPSTGKGISFFQDFLADMISMCEVALIDHPGWFDNPSELLDHEVLKAVFEEVNSFESSFRSPDTRNNVGSGGRGTQRSGDNRGQSQDGSPPQSPIQQSDFAASVVDGQVPQVAKVG